MNKIHMTSFLSKTTENYSEQKGFDTHYDRH